MFTRPYNHLEHEKALAEKWHKENTYTYNEAENTKGIFTMVLPPPNVTGILHMGHAVMLSIEDAMARYKRFRGYSVLFIPGTDHAAIATQTLVEKEIAKKEGKTRHDYSQEVFFNMVDTFAKEKQKTIIEQLIAFGASLDWTRLAFTLDDDRNTSVKEMFVRMYNDGLIYRGARVINWDPKGQTTISDDEIILEERTGTLYTFYYHKDIPIPISTTRPETKFGDTAIAVNPKDTRYTHYIGKIFSVTFCGVPITLQVIADKEVDKEYGTGALGVTPAHSMTDWEIKERHNLSVKQVVNEYAKMCNTNESFDGLKVLVAREKVIEELKKNSLLIKEEEVTQQIPTAERTGAVIEPLPKEQWFVAVDKEFNHFGKKTTLKKLLLSVLQKGDNRIQFIPEYFESTYTHWINNLRDWCISRQIIYGHRIPVWYKGNDIYCGVDKKTETGWVQDTDTLDTWFSSGMWTFSTLGWPHTKEKMKKHHPIDILETGYDILFFWVARMIMMSLYALNEIPFKKIYLHGIARDEQGRKMSKSLGNAIDPRVLSEKYGTDAMRMALLVGSAPGIDIKIREDKIRAYKLFANKIWNATRFVLELTENISGNISDLTETDMAIYLEWKDIEKSIIQEYDEYRVHIATDKQYAYFWHTYCDVLIEDIKKRYKINNEQHISGKVLLRMILKEQLELLTPAMPFISTCILDTIGE